MPKRTKEEAQKTKNAILDAAERAFYKGGVSGTSLQEIAKGAGVTRGAVYWHFRNKTEVLQALFDRATLPQEAILDQLADSESEDPIQDLQKVCINCFREMGLDRSFRRVLTIVMERCEYINDLLPMRRRFEDGRTRMQKRFVGFFERAKKKGFLSTKWTPEAAAHGLHALLVGFLLEDLQRERPSGLLEEVDGILNSFFLSVSA